MLGFLYLRTTHGALNVDSFVKGPVIRISPLTGPGVLLDVWISVLKMTRCAAGCVDFPADRTRCAAGCVDFPADRTRCAAGCVDFPADRTRCAAGCVDFRAKNDQVCCWMCGFPC